MAALMLSASKLCVLSLSSLSSGLLTLIRRYLLIDSLHVFFETDLIANSWCKKVIFRERWRCNYTPDTLAKPVLHLVPSRIITLWRDDSKEDLALQTNPLTVLYKFYKNCWGKNYTNVFLKHKYSIYSRGITASHFNYKR